MHFNSFYRTIVSDFSRNFSKSMKFIEIISFKCVTNLDTRKGVERSLWKILSWKNLAVEKAKVFGMFS